MQLFTAVVLVFAGLAAAIPFGEQITPTGIIPTGTGTVVPPQPTGTSTFHFPTKFPEHHDFDN